MPIQFSNTSNVREFRNTNTPSAVGLTEGRATATGVNNGNAGRNINMSPTNARRNANWSRNLRNLKAQAQRNVRAGINTRPMPRRNQIMNRALDNEAEAINIQTEYNLQHPNLGKLRSEKLAANARLRSQYLEANAQTRNNTRRTNCYDSMMGSSDILECLRSGGKRTRKQRKNRR